MVHPRTLGTLHSWVVLALTGAAIHFQAKGAASLIADEWVGTGAMSVLSWAIPRSVVPAPTELPPAEDVDPVRRPSRAPPPSFPSHGDVDVLNVEACAATTLQIVTEAENPLESVAHLRGPDEKTAHPVSVGNTLGAFTVVYIGFNPRRQSPAVWLEHDDELCQVVMFGAANTSPRNPTGTTRAANPSPDPVRDRIESLDDRQYRVARSLVREALEDPRKLLGNVRPVPERSGSKVVGLRLFGIRPDSVLGQLGLQNGDRLESINGYGFGDPQAALLAYAKLRDASALQVELEREGRQTTLHVSVLASQ